MIFRNARITMLNQKMNLKANQNNLYNSFKIILEVNIKISNNNKNNYLMIL